MNPKGGVLSREGGGGGDEPPSEPVRNHAIPTPARARGVGKLLIQPLPKPDALRLISGCLCEFVQYRGSGPLEKDTAHRMARCPACLGPLADTPITLRSQCSVKFGYGRMSSRRAAGVGAGGNADAGHRCPGRALTAALYGHGRTAAPSTATPPVLCGKGRGRGAEQVVAPPRHRR